MAMNYYRSLLGGDNNPLAAWSFVGALSATPINQRKAVRLPHAAGLKLLTVPRAPKELPVTAHLRNAQGVAEWKLFLNE
jgi:hypothetical protein